MKGIELIILFLICFMLFAVFTIDTDNTTKKQEYTHGIHEMMFEVQTFQGDVLSNVDMNIIVTLKNSTVEFNRTTNNNGFVIIPYYHGSRHDILLTRGEEYTKNISFYAYNNFYIFLV